MSYGTSGGIALTDELIGHLADEAEQGYDPNLFRARSNNAYPYYPYYCYTGGYHCFYDKGIFSFRHRDSTTRRSFGYNLRTPQHFHKFAPLFILGVPVASIEKRLTGIRRVVPSVDLAIPLNDGRTGLLSLPGDLTNSDVQLLDEVISLHLEMLGKQVR